MKWGIITVTKQLLLLPPPRWCKVPNDWNSIPNLQALFNQTPCPMPHPHFFPLHGLQTNCKLSRYIFYLMQHRNSCTRGIFGVPIFRNPTQTHAQSHLCIFAMLFERTANTNGGKTCESVSGEKRTECVDIKHLRVQRFVSSFTATMSWMFPQWKEGQVKDRIRREVIAAQKGVIHFAWPMNELLSVHMYIYSWN